MDFYSLLSGLGCGICIGMIVQKWRMGMSSQTAKAAVNTIKAVQKVIYFVNFLGHSYVKKIVNIYGNYTVTIRYTFTNGIEFI